MAVTQYIGARYVPIFADPAEWTDTRAYEPLTIVLHQGNSFTSKQAVPIGIDISDDAFWAETGSYNAQVEQYRVEVAQYDGRITDNAQAIADEVEARTTEDADLNNAIATEEADRIAADTDLNTAIEEVRASLLLQKEMIWIGDSWSTRFSGALPKKVASMLNRKLHTYATSGTSWFEGGANSFPSQCQSAIADSNIDPSSVDLIIIYGGSNDISHDHMDTGSYTSVINAACNALKEKFKKAEIHILFNTRFKLGNGESLGHINPQLKLWNQVSNNIANSAVAFAHADSGAWCMAHGAYESDDIHPTEGATTRLARRICHGISGGVVPVDLSLDMNQYNFSSSDDFWTGQLYFFNTNLEIRGDVYVKSGTGDPSTRVLATDTLPVELFCGAAAGQATNRVGFPLSSADGRGTAHGSIVFSQNTLNTDLVWVFKDAQEVLENTHLYGNFNFRMFSMY